MKKLILQLLFLLPAVNVFSQATSIFNTTGNRGSGIGTTTLSSHGAGYTGLTFNNATYGGFIDFEQTNVKRASILGDNKGLSLEAPLGYGVHIWANGKENMTFLTNGFTGVGTTAPVAKLDVFGTFLASGKNSNLDPKQTTGNLSYLSASGQLLIGWNRMAGLGETDFIANQAGGSVGGFAFFKYGDNTTTNTTTTELMHITGTGQVLIGTSTWVNRPSIGTNMLAVGGGILTEAVTVKTQSTWPDYVFKSNFNLPAISDVKSYISENHHLPELPSADEIAKNGQNLGKMNELLVKKIEELTLYVIQKDDQDKIKQRQIDQQSKELASQEQQIEKLEAIVSKLTSHN